MRPSKLTRAEQDAILMPLAMAANAVDCALQPSWMSYPTADEAHREIRAGLRLDDTGLDALIASGAYKRPWKSAPDRERVLA